MLNNSLVVNTANSSRIAHTSTSPPVPQEYGATISSLSIVVAAAAFGVSLVSLLRSRKLERGARFEAAYGAPLRAELRTFQSIILKFRAFVFPAGKSVADLKIEIETLRIELEEASIKLAALLKELDMANSVANKNWSATFSNFSERAEEVMQAVAHPSVVAEMDFRAKVEKAQQHYQQSIDDIRAMLDRERAKI